MKTPNLLPQALRVALERRTPRERLALALLAGTALLALWAQLLWSLHGERARLARLVAGMEMQNAAMRHATAAMRGANAAAAPVRALSAEQALASFPGDLQMAGISTLTVQPHAPGQLRLSGNAGFDAWLGWLAKVQAGHGVHVLRAEMEATGGGTVKLEAIIALPGTG